MKLVHQEDFHIDGVEWIQALTDDEFVRTPQPLGNMQKSI